MGRTITWTTTALNQLDEIYEHILKDSESIDIANRVVTMLYESTDILKTHSEIYPLDSYRKNNDGSVRAFECYSYRIAYQITPTKIQILRLRHVSREPLDY